MKKLLLLALVMLGGVMQANAYYSLPGSWDGETWDKTAHQFDSNNTVTITLQGNSWYDFKFYNSDGDSWSGAGNNWNNTIMTYNNCYRWGLNSNDKNVTLATTISGVYTFTLTWDNTTPQITVTYPTSYSRTVSSEFGTICLPYGGTVTGATLYEITGKVMNGSTLKYINLGNPTTNLTAGQAYIFKATASEIEVALSGDPVVNATPGGAIVGNLSPTSQTVESPYYVINSNKIWQAGTNVTIGQYRAYIDLTNVTPATSRSAIFMGFDNDATSIKSVQAENSENVMFNLQGQRVNNAQKGLVIVDGKKMLRK